MLARSQARPSRRVSFPSPSPGSSPPRSRRPPPLSPPIIPLPTSDEEISTPRSILHLLVVQGRELDTHTERRGRSPQCLSPSPYCRLELDLH